MMRPSKKWTADYIGVAAVQGTSTVKAFETEIPNEDLGDAAADRMLVEVAPELYNECGLAWLAAGRDDMKTLKTQMEKIGTLIARVEGF